MIIYSESLLIPFLNTLIIKEKFMECGGWGKQDTVIYCLKVEPLKYNDAGYK
jgi:hypothetical protein